MKKHTKIVATVGPSCESRKILVEMFRAGVDVARLNFSHGSYANHAKLMKNIRLAAEEIKKPVAIMQDIQGPKIRIGVMPENGVEIKERQQIVLNTAIEEYQDGEIPLTYPGLEDYLQAGDRILIDDGHAEIRVIKKQGTRIYCRVSEGWVVRSHKGLNFIDSHLCVPILSAKDKEDIEFGVKSGVDMIALSFVHDAADIRGVRNFIARAEKRLRVKKDVPIFLISKIERNLAVKNIDEILRETDGVMIARGDLAMETDMAELPIIQKTIIDKALNLTKPVIVATQMLDSMQTNKRPTRAEITDVANAVIDHADALMLSNETASGKYPVEAVKMMAEIIVATEKSKFDDLVPLHTIDPEKSVSRAIAGLAGELAAHVGAKAILVASATGKTGRLAARIRSKLPVCVGVESLRAQRQLCLSWGLSSFLLPHKRTVENLVAAFLKFVKKTKMVEKGDRIVMITGEPVGQPGTTNLLEVRVIK